MFKKFKLKSATNRLLEEKMYELALKEIESGQRRDGLWAKALSDAGGDENKAKGIYLKHRVQSMQDESLITDALESENTAAEPSNIDKPFREAGNKEFCEKCGAKVSINYGTAYSTLCKKCS